MCVYTQARKEIRLDGRKLMTREAAHDKLKERFGFPDYYGRNLDALWDLLTERRNLHLIVTHTRAMETGEMKGLLELFRDYAKEGHGCMLSLYPRDEERGEGKIILNPLL